MLLLVGLGNGDAYNYTRHNVGAMVIDNIINNNPKLTAIKKLSFKGDLYKDQSLFVLKPLTFMNNSGESVVAVKNYFNINNIAVIHDDLDLNFGAVRFKNGGGDGGHNGIKSISNHIGSDYIRIKIGIGRSNLIPIEKYVLSKFNNEECGELDRLLKIVAKASCELLNNNLDKISNKYTIKK